MRILFSIIITSMIWAIVAVYHMQSHSVVEIKIHESLNDDTTDGNWDYMNEFKSKPTVEDITCLQKNIFFEAASEQINGRIAVGEVTLNRVKSSNFPKTICDVVKQAKVNSNGVPLKNKCQFSWYCDGLSDTPNLSDPTVKRTWDSIGELTRKLLEENKSTLVGNSTHYHSIKVRPRWSKNFKMHSKVGNHIFYVMSP